MKKCQCGFESSDETLFRKNRNQCKVCYSAGRRKYWDENRDRVNAQQRAYKADNKELFREKRAQPRARYAIAKSQARARGIEFSLTLEEYETVIQQPCHYCQYELCSRTEFGSGLDRDDNSIGYQLDNVLSCGWICNTVKHDVLTTLETELAVGAILAARELQNAF